MPIDPSRQRNIKVAVLCLVTFLGMVGAAYAAVPLYKAFCQATGFDGTVRRASGAPDKILNRTMVIRFDTNVRNLPWDFRPEQVSQSTQIGATQLAFFKVTNTADHPVTGRAVYNVLPESAGPYFQKLECFCFTDQTLQPGQTMEFPVVYFVDPRLVEDGEVNGAKEITLSYTFYPSQGKAGTGGS